jgi:hypothetical protein
MLKDLRLKLNLEVELTLDNSIFTGPRMFFKLPVSIVQIIEVFLD